MCHVVKPHSARGKLVAALVIAGAIVWFTVYTVTHHSSHPELGSGALLVDFAAGPGDDQKLIREFKPIRVTLELKGEVSFRQFPFPKKTIPAIRIPISGRGRLLRISTWSALPLKGRGPIFQGYYELPRGDYSLVRVTYHPYAASAEVFSTWRWRPWGRVRHKWNLGWGLIIANHRSGDALRIGRVRWGSDFHPQWVLSPGVKTMASFYSFPPPRRREAQVTLLYPDGAASTWKFSGDELGAHTRRAFITL